MMEIKEIDSSHIKRPFIVYIIYCAFWILISIALFIVMGPGGNFSVFIPFSDMTLEIILISIVFYPLSIIIGLFIGGYILAPVYLFCHKKIFRKNTEYGIFIKSAISKIKFGSEGLFVSLLAMNVVLIILNPQIVSFSIGRPAIQPENLSPADFVTTFISLLILTLFLSTLLFAGSWFLMDPGILYSTTKKFKETYRPPEIRAVGRWYGQFLKGYAGVSVIFSYFEFITIFFDFMSNDLALFLIMLIIFIPFPVFMILPAIPALILYYKSRNHRIRFILKIAKKLGIKYNIEVDFKIKE